MRTSAALLQGVCFLLGLLLFVAELSIKNGAPIIGPLFLFAGALLGADHTTNPDASSRKPFKIMAMLSTLPFFWHGGSIIIKSANAGEWWSTLAMAGKLGVFALLLLVVAFDQTPFVRRVFRRLGLSMPPKEPT